MSRTRERLYPRGCRARLRLVLLAGVISLAHPALADFWYEHYERAEQALRAKRWEEALEHLNRALEKRGDSSARARTYGMNFTTYFPYLKLGAAYFHLGQLEVALQALETEERLGAIRDSKADHGELKRLRQLIDEAQQQRLAEERLHIEKIVDRQLAEAEKAERRGDLELAMRAAAEALAVSPDDERALTLLEHLKKRSAARQKEKDLEQRAAALVAEGKTLLSDGRFEEASTRFSRALSLADSPKVRALFDKAQSKLRAQLDSIRDAEKRSALIADGLEDAATLAGSGEPERALERLQSVLAVDPRNSEALELQKQLLGMQETLERELARHRTIQGLLAELGSHLEASEFDHALSTAHRLLALDPENGTARSSITTAYRELNRKLLGTGPVRNFPPAIRFADFRADRLQDGLPVQKIAAAPFRLTGTIFDDSPIALRIELASITTTDSGERADATFNEVDASVRSQLIGENTINEFSIDQKLPLGLSVFRVIAKDQKGLMSSSEYAVLYVRPLHRSPWLYATSGLLLITVAGAAYGRRAYRRRLLRTRRFNPYVAGAPVLDEDLFFGREHLIDRILQTVHNNSLLLFGERRIGKTSLLHHIKRRLDALEDPDYEFYSVYIDLQGTPQERFFATVAEDVFETLAPQLEDFSPHPSLESGEDYSYRDFVRDLRAALRILQARSCKRIKLVLLIDEVDALNEYDPRINQKLRSLFMKSFADQLVAVVAGVGIKKHWESEGSPWYNFFEEVEVEPLTRSEAESLIRRPIAEVFALDQAVVDRIVSLTGCRPYLIQKLCLALVDRLHQSNRRKITVDDIEELTQLERA
ncbi:MAG: AAA family ATPase [Acidobacteriota bacterium]|nr:MAG: AAA family ATPase [Acidobacteriota bacterium]